jgi:DNA-binding SARP family transcriptional activator/predicted ATPase
VSGGINVENGLRLHVLGVPILGSAQQQFASDLISAKGQALLIYLAVTGRPHTRTALAGLLWGDLPEVSARANLRLTLSKLRKVLDVDSLRVTRLEIGLENYWLDLAEFQHIAFADLQRLCELYRGDFLEGFDVPHAAEFELWLLGMRQQVRDLAVSALYRHVEAAIESRQIEDGLQAARKLLSIEPWHEEAHRQLMFLLAVGGQRSAALTQYETCRRLLAEELDVEPAPATVELYEQVKAGQVADEASPRRAQAAEQKAALFVQFPPAPRHNLPTQLTPLVGREAELAHIANLLCNPECRLLTLIGPGGIGKTRLALAVAEAQIQAFRDGVRFVPLVGIATAPAAEVVELLLTNIANALDYTFAAQQPPRELLLNYLARQELLLLLDNFEPLLTPLEEESGATDLLLDMLHRAPGVKLLITSQQRLGVKAEWLFDVEGLRYPPVLTQAGTADYPAVQVFTRSVRRLKPDFDPAAEQVAVNQICQLVEGLPLGLELAAGWTRLLSCAEIVARLEQARSTVRTPGMALLATTLPGASGRHQSMGAVLDYSWHLLSQAEQQTFRRLSVFRGGFELDAASAVAGSNLPALASLVDKSWLRQEQGGRFRVHELLRQYAAGQLAAHPAEQATTQQNHARYYAGYLEARRTALEANAAKPILAELDREVENLRAAWEWLSARGEIEAVAAYLEGLWRYYQHKGWFQEAILVLGQVCDREQAASWQRARWHRWSGDANYQMGDLQKSCEQLERAMALIGHPLPATPTGWLFTLFGQIVRQLMHRLLPFRLLSPSPEERRLLREGSRTMGGLAQTYYFAEKEIPLYTATLYDLNLAEQAGADIEFARGYCAVSHTLAYIPLHRLASLYSRLAQQALQRADRPTVKIYYWQVTGIYKLGLGRWREAKGALEQTLDLLDRLDLRRWWEESWAVLALIGYYQGYYASAMSQFADVLASAEYRGDPLAQCWALVGQAKCLLRSGQVHDDTLLALLKKAKALPETFLTLADRIHVNGVLAVTYLYQGKHDLAWQAAETTLGLARRASAPIFWVLEGYAGAAEVFLWLWERSGTVEQAPVEPGLLAQSARQACQSLHAFARIFRFAQPQACLYQGLYDWQAGNSRRANRAWRKSLGLASQLAMPYEQGRAHYEIGRHLPLADPARREHLNRASEIFARLDATFQLALTQDALD